MIEIILFILSVFLFLISWFVAGFLGICILFSLGKKEFAYHSDEYLHGLLFLGYVCLGLAIIEAMVALINLFFSYFSFIGNILSKFFNKL